MRVVDWATSMHPWAQTGDRHSEQLDDQWSGSSQVGTHSHQGGPGAGDSSKASVNRPPKTVRSRPQTVHDPLWRQSQPDRAAAIPLEVWISVRRRHLEFDLEFGRPKPSTERRGGTPEQRSLEGWPDAEAIRAVKPFEEGRRHGRHETEGQLMAEAGEQHQVFLEGRAGFGPRHGAAHRHGSTDHPGVLASHCDPAGDMRHRGPGGTLDSGVPASIARRRGGQAGMPGFGSGRGRRGSAP